MKILIVDDTNENLEAAKTAAKNFPEHEFRFTSSAKKAATLIKKVDAIVTDLFFPTENHNDKSTFAKYYEIYRSMLYGNEAYDRVVEKYYDGDYQRAEEKQEDTRTLMEDGTIRTALNGLVEFWKQKGDEERANKYYERLNNLPNPQFPYGGALMLLANDLQKKLCLVSDIHRHACEYKTAADSIDAMMILLPLMEDSIITVDQAIDDGHGSLNYMGLDEINPSEKNWDRKISKKDYPSIWAEAIKRVIAQEEVIK